MRTSPGLEEGQRIDRREKGGKTCLCSDCICLHDRNLMGVLNPVNSRFIAAVVKVHIG